MTSKPEVQGSECPSRPELRAPQRAGLLLITEDGQSWNEGWAQIDGPWVLFLSDEYENWQSWPMQHVRCIDWRVPVIEAEGA